MTDPITVVQIISASASLVVQCAQVVKGLHDLAGKYKHAKLSILAMAHEVDTVRLAWELVEALIEFWSGDADADKELLQHLHQKSDFGNLIISSLAEDLETYNTDSGGFALRSRYIWNEDHLKAQQDLIRGQAGAMSLLISVLKL